MNRELFEDLSKSLKEAGKIQRGGAKASRVFTYSDVEQIPNFPNYAITKDGKVWSNYSNKWLSPGKTTNGYLFVCLCKNGQVKECRIHRLVLEAHTGRCPDGMEACHNNGNRLDNRIENLRWDTRSNNRKDSIKHGTASCIRCGEESNNHKLTERDVRMIIYMWRTGELMQREIAEIYSVYPSRISSIVNRKSWKYIWSK